MARNRAIMMRIGFLTVVDSIFQFLGYGEYTSKTRIYVDWDFNLDFDKLQQKGSNELLRVSLKFSDKIIRQNRTVVSLMGYLAEIGGVQGALILLSQIVLLFFDYDSLTYKMV